METIKVKFEATTLPRWARNDSAVVALCEKDLAFRVDVCSATTKQRKDFLKKEASRRTL